MHVKTLLVVLALVLTSSMAISQEYSARESFDYPVGAAIDTLMGAAGNGWQGSWYKIANAQANSAVAANTGLPYDELNYTVGNVGNHLESVPAATATEQRYGRRLDKTWPNEAGRVYWISFLMDVKNATDVSTWLGVKLYDGDNGEQEMLGKTHGMDKYTVGSGWHNSAGPEVSGVAWSAGPVWLVGKVVMHGDGNATQDTTFMWITPDPSVEPLVTEAAAMCVKKMTNGFNTVRIEFGGNVGDGLQVSFDELRLGTSWADVSSDIYLARDSFEYPVGAAIDTLMGAAGNGWQGSWYKIANAQANSAVAANTGLPYDELNYTVGNVGNHLESVPAATATEQRYGRRLDKTWPNEAGRVYWISFLMDVKNATDVSTWLGVKLYDGDNGEQEMLGKTHGMDKYTVGSGWHNSAGPEVSDVAWSAGPVWLVGKVVMHGDGNATQDTTFMWITPDPSVEPLVTEAAAMCVKKMTNGFNTVRIEFGGNVGDGLQVSFDELRLGSSWADVSSLIAIPTSVERRNVEKPNQYNLSQNYPNPFNPSTSIDYSLNRATKVRLAVYDVTGREVAVLVDGVQNSGAYTARFSASGLPSGVYFYKLKTAFETISKKMLLVK